MGVIRPEFYDFLESMVKEVENVNVIEKSYCNMKRGRVITRNDYKIAKNRRKDLSDHSDIEILSSSESISSNQTKTTFTISSNGETILNGKNPDQGYPVNGTNSLEIEDEVNTVLLENGFNGVDEFIEKKDNSINSSIDSVFKPVNNEEVPESREIKNARETQISYNNRGTLTNGSLKEKLGNKEILLKDMTIFNAKSAFLRSNSQNRPKEYKTLLIGDSQIKYVDAHHLNDTWVCCISNATVVTGRSSLYYLLMRMNFEGPQHIFNRIIIQVGNNDLEKDVGLLIMEFELLIHMIKYRGIKDIVIIGVPPRDGVDLVHNQVNLLNRSLNQLQNKEDFMFIDLTKSLTNEEGNFREEFYHKDRSHLNKEGTQEMLKVLNTNVSILKNRKVNVNEHINNMRNSDGCLIDMMKDPGVLRKWSVLSSVSITMKRKADGIRKLEEHLNDMINFKLERRASLPLINKGSLMMKEFKSKGSKAYNSYEDIGELKTKFFDKAEYVNENNKGNEDLNTSSISDDTEYNFKEVADLFDVDEIGTINTMYPLCEFCDEKHIINPCGKFKESDTEIESISSVKLSNCDKNEISHLLIHEDDQEEDDCVDLFNQVGHLHSVSSF